MPPDPVGLRPNSSTVIESPEVPDAGDGPGPDWYDRSSLPGDFMVTFNKQTEADYLSRAPDRRFCEFIDGIVYMPPSILPQHQFDTQFLLCLITSYHARRPVGGILSGPSVLKLRDGCWLEPDLFVLPMESRGQIQRDGFGRPPVLLVVEVLSPSNRAYDLDQKATLYREANIAEIWFVDHRDKVLIVERLAEGGYVTERWEAGPVVSRSLPGFWLDAAWLGVEPEPNLLACLDPIFAVPPAI